VVLPCELEVWASGWRSHGGGRQVAQHNHDNGITLGLKVLALVLVVLFRHPITILTLQELAVAPWSGGGRPSSLAEDDH
jgi:hypothetical protein